MRKRIMYGVLFWGILLFMTGCSIEKTDRNKIRDLDFTLAEDSQLPAELAAIIEEKKGSEFRLTFDTEDTKYIVVGYGLQETGGYSISVDGLYETNNAIYVITNLIGPSKGELVTQVETYPYVVIKTEYIDKSVVFE